MGYFYVTFSLVLEYIGILLKYMLNISRYFKHLVDCALSYLSLFRRKLRVSPASEEKRKAGASSEHAIQHTFVYIVPTP